MLKNNEPCLFLVHSSYDKKLRQLEKSKISLKQLDRSSHRDAYAIMKLFSCDVLTEEHFMLFFLMFLECAAKSPDHLHEEPESTHPAGVALELRGVHPLHPGLFLVVANLLASDLFYNFGDEIGSPCSRSYSTIDAQSCTAFARRSAVF